MIKWAIVFLVIAVVAAIFGYNNIAGVSVELAKVLFFIFIILFILALVSGITSPTVK